MADEKIKKRHTVVMEQREKIFITGVVDVISFDEESVTADTEYGVLLLKGFNLHVTKLDLDNCELGVEGEIDSLRYAEGTITKSKGSLFGKIFK